MADSPSLKYNAALLRSFLAKCKVYSRYPRVSEQAQCLPLDIAKLPAHAYNPSIIRHHDKLWMTYRYHSGDRTTKIGIAEISPTGDVVSTQDLALGETSCEDARLFSLHGEPWMSWVEAKWDEGFVNPLCVVKYTRLDKGQDWKTTRIYQPKVDRNDWSWMHKNWCFFESDENLYCINRSWPQQTIFQIQGETVIQEHNPPGICWPYGEIRGDNIIPYEGKFLRVFHSATDKGIGRIEHRYYIGACLLESKPPFNVLAVSKKPILYGSEIDMFKSAERKACFHWKANVVFSCGLMLDEDHFIISVGINDAACAMVRISKDKLNL